MSSIDPIYKKWKNLIEPNLPASMSSDMVAAEYASWPHSVLQDWGSGFCSTTPGPQERASDRSLRVVVWFSEGAPRGAAAAALEEGEPPGS